jgi:hypothetical protein
MKVLLSIVAGAALFVASAGIAGVAQADPLPAGCVKDRSEITCTTTETVGNAPEHSSAQRTVTTTEDKASFESSHPVTTECAGPPGQCR